MRIRISARQSDLARLQAKLVGRSLERLNSKFEIEYLFRESLGDKNLTDPLWKIPEKGVFTEDFYQDLVLNKTDLVVHSWKDLPTEGKIDTQIAATLPREDQRDFLLFKKSSWGKSSLKIFSSSPRRVYNLKRLFPLILPWKTENLEFQSVRGNIQTRVRKMGEDSSVDGLIVAKAAMDRLLQTTESEFSTTRQFLRQVVDQSLWMVLPLSANPTAAAQGALAIEVLSSRKDLLDLLSKINCQKTFQAVQNERSCLQKFGGGCHLALGMSQVSVDDDLDVMFVQGMTPENSTVDEVYHYRKNTLPEAELFEAWSWPAEALHRSNLDSKLIQKKILDFPADQNGFVISRSEAWPWESAQAEIRDKYVLWTAGLKTWVALARKGFWVHGTFDGLGDQNSPELMSILPSHFSWKTLTHQNHPELNENKHIVSYHLETREIQIADQRYFFWRSGSQFLSALKRYPRLKDARHASGPGSTARVIKQTLPELTKTNRFFTFLSEEDWQKSLNSPDSLLKK